MLAAKVWTGASESGAPSASRPKYFPAAGCSSPETLYGGLLACALGAGLAAAFWPLVVAVVGGLEQPAPAEGEDESGQA